MANQLLWNLLMGANPVEGAMESHPRNPSSGMLGARAGMASQPQPGIIPQDVLSYNQQNPNTARMEQFAGNVGSGLAAGAAMPAMEAPQELKMLASLFGTEPAIGKSAFTQGMKELAPSITTPGNSGIANIGSKIGSPVRSLQATNNPMAITAANDQARSNTMSMLNSLLKGGAGVGATSANQFIQGQQ